MLNSRRFGWGQDGGRAMTKKAGLYGTNRSCQGSGVQRVRKTRSARGNWDVNEAGMSLKINDMRKCHPHQGLWKRWKVGDFALREASEANPRGLTHAVAIRYEDSDPSEPKAVIFLGISRLQRKSARFSVNLNAESVRPIKDWVRILRYCLRSSIKQTGEESWAEGPQVGVGRARNGNPLGQGASASTENQRAASGSKECFTIQTHQVNHRRARWVRQAVPLHVCETRSVNPSEQLREAMED